MKINKIGFTEKEYVRALNRIINGKISLIRNEIEANASFQTEQILRFSNHYVLAYNNENGKRNYFIFLDNMDEKEISEKISELQESLGSQWLGAWPSQEQIELMHRTLYKTGCFVCSEEGAEYPTMIEKNQNGNWEKKDVKKARLVSVENYFETDLDSVLIHLIKKNRLPNDYNKDNSLPLNNLQTIISEAKTTRGQIVLSEENIKNISLSVNLDQAIKKELLGKLGLQPDFTATDVKAYLKRCDFKRAHIPIYDEGFFNLENEWLWEFWNSESLPYHIDIPSRGEIIRTRDPRKDIKKGCVIAIDFGTSSTVVVKYDPEHPDEPSQICVGEQNTGKYENPTLILVNQYQKFLQDYYGKDRRPYTNWDDLMVSHPVKDLMRDDTAGNKFKATMSHIKQWAAELNSQLSIIPVTEKEPIELKPLNKLLEKENREEFNPIEIYAYFLGLYLNNRHEGYGIYLDYQLAYPATYTKDMRELITESFRKGLRKSIPNEITDEEIKVEMKISEPEAYAITALQKYKFEPKEGEKVKYAIFDFGGGTSDFAYGYWSKYTADVGNKEWVLETKDVNGEQFLGGENILDGLAFDVFSHPRNLPQLIQQQGGIQKIFKFAYGVEKKQYGKVDNKYLSQNFYGKNNLTTLIEYNEYKDNPQNDDQRLSGFGLRVFWENQEKYFKDFLSYERKSNDMVLLIDKIKKMIGFASENETVKRELEKLLERAELYENEIDKGLINATLDHICKQHKNMFENMQEMPQDIYTIQPVLYYQSDSECMSSNIEIKMSLREMYEYFSNEIQSGVDSFFSALKTAFADDYKDEINIFLAGNASKSPILKKLLSERIEKESNEKVRFKLFNHFDSDDYYEKIREVGEKQNWSQDDIDEVIDYEKKKNPKFQPTGKTGVAFGIISMDKIDFRRSNDGKYFKYYLGKSEKRKGINRFISFDKRKPSLGEWIQAFNPGPSSSPVSIYLYYTTNAACVDDKQPIKIATSYSLQINEIKEGEGIFIKIADVDKIYCVPAKNQDEAERKISEDNSSYSRKIILV